MSINAMEPTAASCGRKDSQAFVAAAHREVVRQRGERQLRWPRFQNRSGSRDPNMSASFWSSFPTLIL
jgi:hypothetical protein